MLTSSPKGSSQLVPIELNTLIPVITGSTDHSLTTLKGGKSSIASLSWAKEIDGSEPDAGQLSIGHYGDNTYLSDEPRGNVINSIVPRNLFADGRNMNISGSTISDLRTAFQLQKLYERDARSGTRYVEMLKAHFGVEAQDYRLQRPEYLGKLSTKVGIHQVAQTSSTDTTSPQGNVTFDFCLC